MRGDGNFCLPVLPADARGGRGGEPGGERHVGQRRAGCHPHGGPAIHPAAADADGVAAKERDRLHRRAGAAGAGRRLPDPRGAAVRHAARCGADQPAFAIRLPRRHGL